MEGWTGGIGISYDLFGNGLRVICNWVPPYPREPILQTLSPPLLRENPQVDRFCSLLLPKRTKDGLEWATCKK